MDEVGRTHLVFPHGHSLLTITGHVGHGPGWHSLRRSDDQMASIIRNYAQS